MGKSGLRLIMAAGFEGKCPTSENQEEATVHFTVQLQKSHSDCATFTHQDSHQGKDTTSPYRMAINTVVAISGHYKLLVPGIVTTSFQRHKCNCPHSDHHCDYSPGSASEVALSLFHR